MRPWRIRLALRRSRIQWALIAIVLVVSTISSTLVGTLYLLTSATEIRAARTALVEAPASDVAVTAIVSPDDVPASAAALRTSAAELWGDIPHSTRLGITGSLIEIPREDQRNALTYFAVVEDIDRISLLRDGEWPGESTDGTVPVAIPTSVSGSFGLSVGDTLDVRPIFGREATTITVTGIYVPGTVDDVWWNLDRLSARGYQERVVVPGTGGRIVTEGFGPLIVTESTFNALESRVGRSSAVSLTSVPDLADVSLEQAAAVLAKRADLETTTQQTVAGAGTDVRVFTSIDTTVGGVIGSLAVTRSSVVVMGLLLLVLSVAALGQTARLMAERRHGELQLMVARGASSRQVLRLGLLEALGLGVVTVVAGAWAARYAYQGLTSIEVMDRAGLRHDPGIPLGVWVVTGVVGVLLVVVAVGPLLKRQGSFIDSQQTHARPSRRSVLQRSGLDIGLVVLAALAYWQLRSYESPVVSDGGLVRLDPLLAAGPALALLAGSLLAVRLIPAASRLLEAVASRGRKAIMPLAAWEVGRRSARAVSAILLLTLAMSVGTFAMSYLATWQQSQEHQGLYQHPQDMRVSNLEGSAFDQAALLPQDATRAPVLDERLILSTDVETPLVTLDTLTGREMRVFASSVEGFESYDQGRLGDAFGSEVAPVLSWEPVWNQGMTIPEGAQGLQLEVAAWSGATALDDITVGMRVVVQDATGALSTVDLGSLDVGQGAAEEDDYVSALGRLPQTNTAQTAYTVVGFQTVWFSTDEDVNPGDLANQGLLELVLSVNEWSSYTVAQNVPVVGQDPVTTAEPLDVVDRSEWTLSATRAGLPEQALEDDVMRIGLLVQPNPLRLRPSNLTLSLTEQPGPLPVVLTATAASTARVEVGEPVRVSIDGSIVDAVVGGIIPILPDTNPRQSASLVNLHHLNAILIQQGSPPLEPTQWWLSDVADVTAAQASLPPEAQVTTRNEVVSNLADNPLRVATQAAIWLVVGAAVVLAAVGFAVHAIVTVRARETEFAQLRAVGVRRGQLMRVIASESLLLSVLGVAFGVGIGVALGYLVAPLVTVGADGRAPLPTVLVEVPWEAVALLACEVFAVLTVTVILVGFMVRRINPAIVLRMGD